MSDKVTKVGVNTIVIKNNKFLLGKRINGAGHGFWGVPGGHLEFGEMITEGAKRELEEETGLIADEIEFVGLNNQFRPSTNEHYIQINFVVRKFHGQLENREPDHCAGWEWYEAGNLPQDLFIAHKDFIQDYLDKKLLRDEILND